MRNYLLIGAIVIISLAGIWLLAADSDEAAEQTPTPDNNTPTEPEVHDPSAAPADTLAYTSQFNDGLSLNYPVNWNVTDGDANSADQQLVTFESPIDGGGFYFCLDLTEVSPASQLDFGVSMAAISAIDGFSAAGIGQDLHSVIFEINDNPARLWALADSEPQMSDTRFSAQISNPAGRRLQTLGRFNCRDEQPPALTLEQFQNSRWFNEARAIALSLTY